MRPATRYLLLAAGVILLLGLAAFSLRTYFTADARWASLNSKAEQLSAAGRYDHALRIAHKALDLAQRKFLSNDLRITDSLEQLARLSQKSGDSAAAQQFAQLAWDSLNTHVTQLSVASKADEAFPLATRSLNLAQDIFGPQDIRVATSLENLAHVHADLGHAVEAEQSAQRAWDIARAVGGPDDVHLAEALYSMAIVFSEEQKFAQAEPLAREALAIRERALPPDDPGLALYLHLVAYLDQMQFHGDKYSEAEGFYLRAIAIREKNYGADDVNIAPIAGMLGRLYLTLARDGEAEPLLQRQIALETVRFGPNHPDVLTTLAALANLQFRLQEYSAAADSYRAVLEIVKSHKENDSAFTVAAYYTALSETEQHLGNLGPAESAALAAVHTFDTSTTPVGSQSEPALTQLAVVYKEEGKTADFISTESRLAEIEDKQTEFRASAEVLAVLIATTEDQGDYSESLKYHLRRIAALDHARNFPDAIAERRATAVVFRRLGRLNDAVIAESQADQMLKYN